MFASSKGCQGSGSTTGLVDGLLAPWPPQHGDDNEVSRLSKHPRNSLCTDSAGGRAGSRGHDDLHGRYVGSVTVAGGRISNWCDSIPYVDMTITGGRVVIHEILSNGIRPTFRGTVNAAGEVSTSRWLEVPPTSNASVTVDSLSGTLHDKVFSGQLLYGYWCYWKVHMTPAPAPTNPFDGDYTGVSKDVLDGGSTAHRCDPRTLPPPRPLSIRNGVVGIPGVYWWEGTLSPQGALVIRSPVFSRVDGQIDHQGTIRGQYSGDIPSRLGGGTNCVVKFVWQKE